MSVSAFTVVDDMGGAGGMGIGTGMGTERAGGGGEGVGWDTGGGVNPPWKGGSEVGGKCIKRRGEGGLDQKQENQLSQSS